MNKRRIRSKSLEYVLTALTGLAAALLLSFLIRRLPLTFPNDAPNRNELIIVGALLVGSASLLIPLFLRYLQPQAKDRILHVSDPHLFRRVHELRREVSALRELVHKQAAGDQTLDPSALIEDIRAAASNEIVEDVRKEFEARLSKKAHIDRCRNAFERDEGRLLTQLSILRRRGNLNLAIGVVTTLGAVLVLVLTVYSVGNVAGDTRKLIAYFVPRLSTVIFVEVFSFFFLKLYRSTLDEEKFYQNELTTQSSRNVAFEASLQLDDSQATAKLIDTLASPRAPENLNGSSANPSFDAKDVSELLQNTAKMVTVIAKAKGES